MRCNTYVDDEDGGQANIFSHAKRTQNAGSRGNRSNEERTRI